MKSKKTAAEKIEGGVWVRDGFAREPEPESPVVSIITACLNSEKHLERTIQSVLGQTYGDIEYIVVDGGSSDGTLDILRRYDESISYWVSEPDDGTYDAINKGISMATGSLVGIVNSESWYLPHAVEEVVKAGLEDPDARVFFGPLYEIDPEGEVAGVREGAPEKTESGSGMDLAACFVRRAVYDDYRFNVKYRLLADYDLMLRLHLAGMRFRRIDRPLARQRCTGESPGHYRSGVESCDVRWDNDLLSPWQYVTGRLALVFTAPLVKLRRVAAREAYGEIDELRRKSGCLHADNLALKYELAAASAQVARVETALAEREAEVARLNGEVARLSLALDAGPASSPAGGFFQRFKNLFTGR